MSIAYMAGHIKRNITQADIRAAATLSALWEDYKSKPENKGITETGISAKLGITQSMFNQLKNGTVTWSTDHVLKMAYFFGVNPDRFKIIPYLRQPEKTYTSNQELPSYEFTNEFQRQLLYFFNGLTLEHREDLLAQAQAWYIRDNPGDRLANPFPTGPRPAKSSGN